MRILLLFIILCKCFGLLFAEQIITKEYNAPRQGDILHKQKIEYIDPDDSGINILWDLRNVVVIDNDYETSYFTTDSLLALKDRKTCYYYKVIGDTLFGCGYNNYQTQMTDSIAPIAIKIPSYIPLCLLCQQPNFIYRPYRLRCRQRLYPRRTPIPKCLYHTLCHPRKGLL